MRSLCSKYCMVVSEEQTVFFMVSYHAILCYACLYMVSQLLGQHQERHYPTDELDVRFDPIFYFISRSEYKCGYSCKYFHGGSVLIIWNDSRNSCGRRQKIQNVIEGMCTALKYISGHSLKVTTKDSQLINITYFSTKHKQ